MINRIEKLNSLQEEAAQALFEHQKGTVEVATGVGKTFVSFKAAYKVKELAENTFGHKYRPTLLFLAETTVREKTLREEAKKFKSIFDKDLYKDFKIKFACYQSRVKKLKFDILIADEAHDALSPVYSEIFFDNEFKYIFCLSALIPDTLFDSNDEASITKREFLDKVAPIVFTYSLNQGIEDGILSPFKTVILYHELDKINKSVIVKTKKGKFKFTEYEYYTWRKDKIAELKLKNAKYHDDINLIRKNNFLIRKLALENTRLLWKLPSKRKLVLDLLNNIDSKSIIFGTDLTLVHSICKKTVSSRNSEEVNNSYIRSFNKGKIKNIGSFKMLKQGITLEGVQNTILASYYSQIKDMIQMLGRSIRFVEGKEAILYIVVTRDTLEEKWVKLLASDKNVNLNINLE